MQQRASSRLIPGFCDNEIHYFCVQLLARQIKRWLRRDCSRQRIGFTSLDNYLNYVAPERAAAAPHVARELQRYPQYGDIQHIEPLRHSLRVMFGEDLGLAPVFLAKSDLCALAAPSPRYCQFYERVISPRLVFCNYRLNGDNVEWNWTTNLGFYYKNNAQKYQTQIRENKLASYAQLRRGSRTTCPWELKVWGLKEQEQAKIEQAFAVSETIEERL
ncbi:hypothetical protein NG796_16885 [Laspinema sp. A4]|uniref:hypothetical protein n=1 Tax=Laspinema sp. D2d TaxID=2953686 RepID=UPI0021BAE7CF|nr:hypothetical protein [Laspinema sp. D2d]MCT7984949.1 hypothetical protein [Laspinema sp. D2d]